MAGWVIAMRKMKDMHFLVVSAYVNLFLALISIFWVSLSPIMNFDFLWEITLKGWLLFFIVGVLSVGEQTIKFTALKNQEATKLQRLSFLPNLWQFLLDLVLI